MPKSLISWMSYLLIAVAAILWLYGAWSEQYQYVFYWTDILVYVLLAVILSFILYARRKEHLRQPWRHIFSRRLAMMSLVFLLCYVFLGLLDSVHFRHALPNENPNNQDIQYSSEISSLDLLLGTLKAHREKTYSAPLATHLFAKEAIKTETGTVRDYPRLVYGGSHLENPTTDKTSDLMWLTLKALLQTVLFFVLINVLLIFDLSRHYAITKKQVLHALYRGELPVPWREILVAIGLVAFTVFMIANIGSKYHIMGTDKVGNDVLYLSLKSIRTGLVIGTLTTLIMLPFAIALGIMAGYFRSLVDDIIQFTYTTLNSIPGVLLIAAAVLSLQLYMQNNPDKFASWERADLRLLFLCGILGITSWTGLCRILRGETMKLAELDYVQAAKAFGVRQSKILIQHILPNVMHLVLISVVLDFSGLVLAEAVLSYVGVGVDPTTLSWGNMINGARLEMAREPIVWWSLVSAFVFMFALVLSANLFSDAVRDAFDPRLARVRA